MKVKPLWICFLLLAFSACVGIHEEEEPVVVPVIDPEDGSADIGTRFFHRLFVYEFTATWCQYCPNMNVALEAVRAEWPGRIIPVAVHQYDDMSARVCDTIVSHFSISGFPHLIFDFDGKARIQQQDPALIKDYVEQALPSAAACGVAIDAEQEGRVQIKVKAAEAGEYALSAALVEDGIVARQTGAGDNYVNNAVLRATLTASFAGEPLGNLIAGDEVTRSFPVDPGENLRIVACVLKRMDDGNYRAVNAAQCALNKKIDYRYEPDLQD